MPDLEIMRCPVCRASLPLYDGKECKNCTYALTSFLCPNCHELCFDGFSCRQCGYSKPVKSEQAPENIRAGR